MVEETETDTFYIWIKEQANEMLAFLEERNGYKLRYEEAQSGYDSSKLLVTKYKKMVALHTTDSSVYAQIIAETAGKFDICTSDRNDCREELEKVKEKVKRWRGIAIGSLGLNVLLILILIVAI